MNKKLKKVAFTVIELIIVLGIVAIIAGILLANYQVGRQYTETENEARKFALVLREAQSNSFSGKLSDTSRPYGYGVKVDSSTSYFVFAELYPSGSPNYTYDSGQDKLIQTFSTQSYITISPLSTIAFTIPQGKDIYLDGVKQTSGSTTFSVINSQNNQTVLVRINNLTGKIEIIK